MRLHLTLIIIMQAFCFAAFGQLQKIYLNPKTALVTNQSVFIDSLKFHPLDYSKEVTIGRFNSLYITDEFYIIVNSTDKECYIYNKAGKYLHKISYTKFGDEAWPRYDKHKQQLVFFFVNKNYSLTKKDKIKIKSDFTNQRNKKYYKKYLIDLHDSSFSIQKTEPTAFDILNAYNLKDDLYCTYEIDVNKNYKDTIDYEVKIFKNTNFIKGYFPYNKRDETRYLFARYISASTQESQKPDVFYISRPYKDTVYALMNNVVTPIYQLVLPMENSLPPSFFSTPFKNATDRENFERNNGWLLKQVYISYESDRFILFVISFLSNYGQYIYDKKTTATYNVSKIKPDSLTYYLPIITENIASRDGDKLYMVIPADDLTKAYGQNNKDALLPEALKQCLQDKTNPRPLIAEFTLKAN